MKKLAIVYFLCTICVTLSAQSAKLPRLVIETGLLTEHYILDNKVTPAKQVRLHLEKTDAEAYRLWRNADRADVAGTVWSIPAAAGLLTGLLSKDAKTQTIGYGVCAVGMCGVTVCLISSGSKRKRAVRHYNTTAGY